MYHLPLEPASHPRIPSLWASEWVLERWMNLHLLFQVESREKQMLYIKKAYIWDVEKWC